MTELEMFMTAIETVKNNATLTTEELMPIMREALDIEADEKNDFIMAVLIENCKNAIENFNQI